MASTIADFASTMTCNANKYSSFKNIKNCRCLISVISKQIITCILIKTEKLYFFSKMKILMISLRSLFVFEVNCMLLKLCPIKKTKNVKVITESLEIIFYFYICN